MTFHVIVLLLDVPPFLDELRGPALHTPLRPAEHVHLDLPLRTGAEATVWQAVTDEGRVVAAKVARTQDPDAVERLLAEARTLSRCAGPHVLPVLGVREDADQVLLVVPLAEASLADVLQDLGPLPTLEVRRLCLAMVLALRACHRRGIVHADVKPENVLRLDGDWLLADFGVAVAIGEGRGTLGVVGSAAWMDPSPGEALPRRDLWAVAAMTVEAATGRTPFPGTTPADVLRQAGGGLGAPVDLPDDPDLAVILTRALDPEPSRRPTASQWLRFLTTSGVDTPEVASLTPPATTTTRAETRQRLRAAALVGAAAVTATTLGAAIATLGQRLTLGG